MMKMATREGFPLRQGAGIGLDWLSVAMEASGGGTPDLLCLESVGMMKMDTGEGFPLRQGAGTGLDWFSVATGASGGGTPDLLCSRMFLGYMEIYRRKKYARGATRGPRGWRACPAGVGAPPASWPPRRAPDVHSKSIWLLSFQK